MSTLTTAHDGLLVGFRSAWALVEHGSAHHLRLHLANLRTVREVCVHLASELDELIALAEKKLAEHESLDRDVRAFEKVCTGRRKK